MPGQPCKDQGERREQERQVKTEAERDSWGRRKERQKKRDRIYLGNFFCEDFASHFDTLWLKALLSSVGQSGRDEHMEVVQVKLP